MQVDKRCVKIHFRSNFHYTITPQQYKKVFTVTCCAGSYTASRKQIITTARMQPNNTAKDRFKQTTSAISIKGLRGKKKMSLCETEGLLKPGATNKNETHHALKRERPKNIKRILSSLRAVSFMDQIKRDTFQLQLIYF